MNSRILGLMSVGLMVGPIAANAQVTTLDYQGSVMYGTSDYLPTGLTQTNSEDPFTTLPTSPVTGSFTASITVDGSFGSTDLTLTSFNVAFNGNNGTSISIVDGFGGLGSSQSVAGGSPFGVGQFFAGEGIIDVTPSGATISITSVPYHGTQELITIGPSGDSFSYSLGTFQGSCANFPGADGGTYTGPTINPCDIYASNTQPGIWSVATQQAPEIDPASAASGLTLLLGGLAVLRHRPLPKSTPNQRLVA